MCEKESLRQSASLLYSPEKAKDAVHKIMRH